MLTTGVNFLSDYGAVRALLSWPKFSYTSYKMISALVKQNLRPRTVIDVGANVGQFAIAVARLMEGAHVHSYEPHPGCFEKLKRNVAGLPNVTVMQRALGNKEGELMLRINSHSHSSSLLPLAAAHREAFPFAEECETASVKVSTLDLEFADRKIESPALLKLDVQGYESNVLLGGAETLKRIDYVILETSFKPLYEGEMVFREILSLMETHGFRFVRPVGWLSDNNTGEVLQMDALFARHDDHQAR